MADKDNPDAPFRRRRRVQATPTTRSICASRADHLEGVEMPDELNASGVRVREQPVTAVRIVLGLRSYRADW